MTTITLAAALFGCLLLHSIVLTSTASKLPDSDLPFEFNHDKGSVITENNILTQSVSSNGENVFKTNDPQPIKKYQSKNKKSTKNQNLNNKQMQNNAESNAIEYPAGHSSTSYSTFPMMDHKSFFEHLRKLIPGFSNVRIQYI